MRKPKVFLPGGDAVGWALDEDLELVRQSLQDVVEFTNFDNAEVIHAVWWESLIGVAHQDLTGRRIICQMSGEPFRYMGIPEFASVRRLVGLWIAQTNQAAEQLSAAGMNAVTIPYIANTRIFRPLHQDDHHLNQLRVQLGLPPDRYLIGNFHRDTEGKDLVSPKLVKGPDIFAEILAGLVKKGLPIHALLAGPRRMWLRQRLEDLSVGYTYVGTPGIEDDLPINILPRESLNLLYNIINLYLVSSRSEGGPRSILESIAAGCPVISTPVGLAPETLSPDAIYSAADSGVQVISQEIVTGRLRSSVHEARTRLLETHSVDAVARKLMSVYQKIDKIEPVTKGSSSIGRSQNRIRAFIRKTSALMTGQKVPITVGLWHNFVPPPYGGGNQFMLALRSELLRQGAKVVENRLSHDIDAYVLNSVQFDVERFHQFASRKPLRILHRIDGPIQLIRGLDREKDDLCFELNQRYAAATVIQSNWTYRRLLELGYHPVNPVIIRNGVNGQIFNSDGRPPFDNNRKIRLISSSWSDNPRKGGATYRWMDQNLNWDRFDFTFVGRVAERFERIRQIPPVPSEQLAELLRSHDIFITASRNDPCSNAVLEALTCGLPVLYLNDGGHPELVGYGGLPFECEDEIISQLEKLVESYDMFQRLIVVPSIAEVTTKYLSLLREITDTG